MEAEGQGQGQEKYRKLLLLMRVGLKEIFFGGFSVINRIFMSDRIKVKI